MGSRCARGGAFALLGLASLSLGACDASRTDAGRSAARPAVPLELPGVLVQPAWLAAHAEYAALLVIDARESERYAEGHLPGAVSLPYRQTLGAHPEPRDDIAPVQTINEVFGRSGISQDTTVVIYGDDRDYRPAAWLFWVLEVHGHARVGVLDGGIPAWLAAGHALSREPAQPHATRFVAEMRPERLADQLEVHRAMRDAGAVILDARSADEYTGAVNAGFARSGHIPTAINRSAAALYVEDGTVCTMQDPRALAQTYEHLRGRKVYTYCSTGRSASVVYLALRSAALDAAVYDGSWREWSADERSPIALGADPGAAP